MREQEDQARTSEREGEQEREGKEAVFYLSIPTSSEIGTRHVGRFGSRTSKAGRQAGRQAGIRSRSFRAFSFSVFFLPTIDRIGLDPTQTRGAYLASTQSKKLKEA